MQRPILESAPVNSSVTAFPIDESARRGPGRPPKLCATCGKMASECKGHAAAPFSIGESTVKGILQMFSHLTALSFAVSTGLPLENLHRLWQFSEGESAVLLPPTTELINKNAPEWLIRWETELKVGFVLLPILITKLTVTHAMVQAMKQQKEKQASSSSSPSPAESKSVSPQAAAA
jgi:hypothetical protein